MTPPEEHHRHCPACGAWFRWWSRSGNGLGAICWSDGCVVGPMLPDTPPIVRCPACARWIRLEDAAVRHLADGALAATRPIPPSWPLLAGSPPERLDHWFEALEGELSPEHEADLRLHLVWASNHRFRGRGFWGAVARRHPRALDSWLRLVELTPELWLKGELLRQIERYDEAAGLLARSVDAGEVPFAGLLLRLCRDRTPWVVPVRRDGGARLRRYAVLPR